MIKLIISSLIALCFSYSIKNGIVDIKDMENKPIVIITNDFVKLQASSSLRNSATGLCEIKYKIDTISKHVYFSGIDGIVLIGKYKNYKDIKMRKFKNIDPINFDYFYINTDGTKMKIEPEQKEQK